MAVRVLAALGIDAAQWRSLSRAYIVMDFRAAGGAVRQHKAGRAGGSPLAGLLAVSGVTSVVFAFVAAGMSDTLLSASLLTTYAAATTTMLLLVDFTGIVISPDDYGILAHRPVGSRTYFAARLAAIAAYVASISLVTALVPAIVYGVRTGPLAFPATLLAVLLCNLTMAVLVVTGYVSLLRWVHPSRLRRAMSYLQLVAASTFYLLYYLVTRAFGAAFLERKGFEDASWMWAVPSTWFASFVAVAAGHGTLRSWTAAGAALLLCGLCVPLAAGRLSLDYARRLGEMTAVGEPARRRDLRLPGFSRGEARAVALLVRAQFRYDQRFRMGVLGVLPLTGFYMLLGINSGALVDPFVSSATQSGGTVFFAVVFIPMTLHAALSVSESWRAAWIFFASPASHARIVIAAKNFISVYFLGIYLVALAAFWSYFFEHAWHAVVHALFAGLLAHLLLQLVVIAKPALPFAAEPRKAERSAAILGIFIAGSITAAVFPVFLHFVYRSLPVTFGVLVSFVAVTAAVEYAVRLRVDEAIGELEFRS